MAERAQDAAPAPMSAKITGQKRRPEAPADPMIMKRLIRELRDIGIMNTRKELGIVFELLDEDDPCIWRAKWYYDMEGDQAATPTQNALALQLKERGLEYIEFRMVFPTSYPREAPFVYNYYPRLVGSYIFGNGGLCAQTLSTEYG